MKSSDMTFHLLDGTKIRSAKELSETVYNTIHYYESREAQERKRASMTREEVAQEIHNEWEEENKRLKERLRLSIVELNSQKELDEYDAFVAKHKNCKGSRIGNDFTPILRQYGTGFGIGTIVSCPICQEAVDITDTSCW